MAKKIFGTIATGIVLLLSLFFAVVMLFRQRGFFGTAIMWLLFLCVAILFIFVIYLVFSRITEITKESRLDESNLSERHIEKILSTGTSASINMMLNEEERAALEEATRKKEELYLDEERLKNIKKQEEFDALKKEAAERERADWESQIAKPQQELETKIERIKKAEDGALERANQMPDESDRRFAMGEHEALQRARFEAEDQLKSEVERYAEARQVAENEQRKHMEMQELRKSQEMESVKRQAEAMDVARRRAAQASASGVLQITKLDMPPATGGYQHPAYAPQTPVAQNTGHGSAGISAPPYGTQTRPNTNTGGYVPVVSSVPSSRPGYGKRALPTSAAQVPPARQYTPATPNRGNVQPYTPMTTGGYPPTGSGYVVPKFPSTSQQFSSGELRTLTQQAAAARVMGGVKPVYDTHQFNTEELRSFQEMNAAAEAPEKPAYTPTTLPGSRPTRPNKE